MADSLRILILEDNPADVELTKFELQEAGFIFSAKVVMNEKDFVNALHEFSPDLILSDYDLPQYNGALALAEAMRSRPDTPFILVTGAVGEDRAIEILTQGAKDYVLKTRLQQKLVPAVRRALVEAEEHRGRRQAEENLREAYRTLEERVEIRTAELAAEMTERRKKEKELDQQAQLMDLSYDAIFIWPLDGAIEYWNMGAERLYGYTRNEAVSRVSDELLHTQRPMDLDELKMILARDGQWFGELIHVTKDSRTVTVESRHQLVQDDSGRKIVLETTRDITERKRIEEELRLQREWYQVTLASIGDAVIATDTEGHVTFMNAVAEALTGWTFHDASARPITEIFNIINEFNRQSVESPVTRVLNEGVIVGLANHTLLVRRDGTEVPIDNSGAPIRDTSGKILGVALVFRDITERKELEKVQTFLAQTSVALSDDPFFNMLARYIGENLNMDYVCIDRLEGDGLTARTVAVWNDGYFEDNVSYALKDTPCGAVVGKTVCCFPTAVCKLFPNDEALKELKAESYVGVTLFGHTGQPIGLIAVIGRNPLKNRTLAENVLKLVAVRAAGEMERLEAENALKEQAHHLEDVNKELESFSYSVSHDLKAPLRAIDGYSRMLVKKYGDTLNEDAAHILSVIRSSADKMNVLIEDLLSFSKVLQNSMIISEIDMDKLVSEVWGEIHEAHNERELEFRITKLLPGFGDKALIRQVLFNLISNAVKFTKARKPSIIEMSCYSENGRVVYCLNDNGVGFDMTYYSKLFGVFQRLHGNEYDGTGVGLAIVQRIINRHGGQVWATGEVDTGATFYFTLPQKET